jgi:isopentenyl-diphosphate delta-isomerase
MGLDCELTEVFSLVYKADVGDGLTENEFDHVFTGFSNQDPQPNPDEVSEWKWVSLSELDKNIQKHPENYTVWFRIIFPKIFEFKSAVS